MKWDSVGKSGFGVMGEKGCDGGDLKGILR